MLYPEVRPFALLGFSERLSRENIETDAGWLSEGCEDWAKAWSSEPFPLQMWAGPASGLQLPTGIASRAWADPG